MVRGKANIKRIMDISIIRKKGIMMRKDGRLEEL